MRRLANIVLIAVLCTMGLSLHSGFVAADKLDLFIIVLGVAQDGGVPHALCEKSCCSAAWDNPSERKRVSSIGIVDQKSKQCWLIDATPDLPAQLRALQYSASPTRLKLTGVLLTHGHIGHYTGLMFLGREVASTKALSVYAMPRMKQFLSTSGPWDQLVALKNIHVVGLKDAQSVQLNDRVSVTPILVPHRDEYTETVGFSIRGPSQSCLFIPDIDKWNKWDESISDLVRGHDVAFLDGTFYDGDELPGRDINEVPHPFIIESMKHFESLSQQDRHKIRFIHLNHTNPALDASSNARETIEKKGFIVADEGDIVSL